MFHNVFFGMPDEGKRVPGKGVKGGTGGHSGVGERRTRSGPDNLSDRDFCSNTFYSRPVGGVTTMDS